MNPRWVKPRLVAAGILMGGTVFLAAPEARAVTGTGSNQLVTFSASAQLSIAASPASLGSLTASISAPLSLGSVVVTDTEADSTNWTASVASSDCFPPTSPAVANATVPATALTFNAGSGTVAPTLPLTTGTPASATLGGSFSFPAAPTGGTLPTPTFGSSMTVASTNVSSTTFASDPVNNDGTYTVTPKLTLNLSNGGSFLAVPETYTCTLQYTITG
jgi:hypothetical protein